MFKLLVFSYIDAYKTQPPNQHKNFGTIDRKQSNTKSYLKSSMLLDVVNAPNVPIS